MGKCEALLEGVVQVILPMHSLVSFVSKLKHLMPIIGCVYSDESVPFVLICCASNKRNEYFKFTQVSCLIKQLVDDFNQVLNFKADFNVQVSLFIIWQGRKGPERYM